MAGSSAGSIQLDLELNRGGFDRQLSSIADTAKKAGLALATAFSVKKLIDFGKSCINLGSDLTEVQNVVDVTFTSMSARVDKFAKEAVVNLGLSETMAKKYMGTIGAMSKSLGFSEKAAYDMSEGIASLAGDVASFYNISQDSAFDKLQSIFTGTLLPLREFGINMSQAALQEFALRNGITKSIDAMTEQEKVMLRYQFVMDGLKDTQGDFARTSGSWANQIRILKLQFDSLKAAIGQGLINVLLPVVKMINSVIGRVMSLANAFKSFTDLLSGGKSSKGASVSKTAGDMGKMEKAAGGAGKALGGAGGAAKKAAKDIASATTGIDELNIISKPDSGGDEGGSGGESGGGGGADYGADEFDMGALSQGEGVVDSFSEKIKGLIDYIKELGGLFKEGFTAGLGDTSVFDSIKASIESIGDSMKDIFLSPEVLSAADNFVKTSVYAFGQMTGAALSIGLTVADNLLGGVSKFLEQNKNRVKKFLVNMFDIGSETAKMRGNFAVVMADIFSVFRSDEAKQMTGNFIGIFADGFMGVMELSAKFKRDLLGVIVTPITENAEGIKGVLLDLISTVSGILETAKGLIDYFMDSVNATYDAHIKPFFDAIATGLSSIVETLITAYNDSIKPVLDMLGEKFNELSEKYLKPLVDKFMDFVGKLFDGLTKLWNTILVPFINWFIENVAPIIRVALENVIDIFFTLLGHISEVVGGIFKALGGLIDFIVGVFTGNWSQAWEGIKAFFAGIWEAILGILSGVLDLILGVIKAVLNTVMAIWTMQWNAIKTFVLNIWNAIKNWITEKFNAIKEFIDTTLNNVKEFWASLWDEILKKVSEIWESIKEFVSSTFTNIQTTINTTLEDIKSFWADKWEEVKTKASDIWEGIKSFVTDTFNNIKSGIEDTLSNIKQTWSDTWESVKSTTQDIWNGIWDTIKGTINSIIGGVESMVNSVVRAINSMIEGINDVVANIPGVDSDVIPTLSEVNLPRLAQGGYVRANTPQLALIGDNKYQGEVVAPEGKLQEMADRAARYAAGSGTVEQMEKMVDLMSTLVSLVSGMDLTVNFDVKEFTKRQDEARSRIGYKMT